MPRGMPWWARNYISATESCLSPGKGLVLAEVMSREA